MKIIEKIEIKNFRSFGNRKKSKTQIIKINDLNIFSGANDSGKSNILRALNLFFNGETSAETFLNFSKDFFTKKDNEDDKDDVKEEMITIRINFLNKKNSRKNIKRTKNVFLPEKFWVSRKFLRNSRFSDFNQVDGVETSFRKEKDIKVEENNFYEKVDNKIQLKSPTKASLSKQLSDFLDSIYFHYVPAIKDKNYFSFLYGELQKTLLKEFNSDVDKSKNEFQSSIQETTSILMEEFKKIVDDENVNISPAFELPNLIDLFKSLNVQTGLVELKYRGDGIQAKLIPEILNFIAIKELTIKKSKLKKGGKLKKYFIWGFEEPENSYEYKNAQLLANRFKDTFVENAQIFLTTHSFNFLSIDSKNTSIYRVWKDEKIKSSRVLKVKKENGVFVPNEKYEDEDFDLLNDELGFLQLNQELEKIYKTNKKEKKELKNKINSIEKPVIYTEGNNVKYLKKAKEFYASELDIDIESLGGKTDIKKFFIRFANAKFSRFKIFFVFDCDAIGDFKACQERETEFLIPYIFEQNKNNNIEEVQSGIENLFSEELFEEEKKIFSVTETRKDEKIISRKRSLRKSEFCDFVCNERNNEEDFKNFEQIFEIIENTILKQ